MAFENLFIRVQKQIEGIQLDAMLIEDHNTAVRLTKNPIEVGAEITDHSIFQPRRISLLVEVSDNQLGVPAFSKIVDDVTGLFGTSTEGSLTRSQSAYKDMVKLQELREPVTVQTKLENYQNMIIIGIRVTQDKSTSRVALMAIDMEQVILVETEISKLSDDELAAGKTAQQGSPPNKRGRQEPLVPSDEVQTSILKSLFDFGARISSTLFSGDN